MTVNQWLPNPGTGNPVREGETLTELRFRNGEKRKDDGRNWHWGAVGGTFDITHYQVSPPRKAEPATMSADEVLIRAREAAIEVEGWDGECVENVRNARIDSLLSIKAILAYERDRAKPLAEVAPHTAEDPDERTAYDLYVKQCGNDLFPWGDRHASSWYRSILAAIKRGRELERGE